MRPTEQFLPGPGVSGLVSVIVPTYNRAHLIGETIDSLLAQTYPSFEAIIVDDGSQDDTRGVVSRYRDPRIRYHHTANGGLSAARNHGFTHAQGEFIAFLDSDDLWSPWKLAAQVAIFRRRPEVGLIWTDMAAFEDGGRITHERYLRTYYGAYEKVDLTTELARLGTLSELTDDAPSALRDCGWYEGDVFNAMFFGNLVHPPAAIVSRARLQQSGPFEPQLTGKGGEDYHFYFKIAELGPVALIDAPAMSYRVHPNQMSSTGNAHEAHGDLRVFTHWIERHPDRMSRADRRERLLTTHAWIGRSEFDLGNNQAVRAHLWASLRLRPLQSSLLLVFLATLLPANALATIRATKQNIRRPLATRFASLVLGLLAAIFLILWLLVSGAPELAGP